MDDLEERYRSIREQIPSTVTLIAVSKFQHVDSIEELYRLGHRDFGENYAQELVSKAEKLEERGCTGIRWHFIGALQSNKIKAVVPWVTAVHTVASERKAQELARRWRESGRPGRVQVFVEVNLDDEPSKEGVPPSKAQALAQAASLEAELQVLGLMCIPEPGSKRPFERLRALESECRPFTSGGLSMGMSADFVEAIKQGATHVRLGTLLFGPRPVSG